MFVIHYFYLTQTDVQVYDIKKPSYTSRLYLFNTPSLSIVNTLYPKFKKLITKIQQQSEILVSPIIPLYTNARKLM